MHGATMPWQPSPSGTVWRKRFHLVGGAETGQVTSLVRYQAQASFPGHGHPGGEEILVCEGVFSDEHGDYPAGSYLLNPEGFSHAPFSRQGCVLFVKLRQYPGVDRRHVALQTRNMPWQPRADGSQVKSLFSAAGFPEQMYLERWPPGPRLPTSYPGGVEILVLEGEFEDDAGRYQQHSWLRLPAGAGHQPRSREGCELYVKYNGLALLQSASQQAAEAAG